MPIQRYPYDAKQTLAIAQKVKNLPGGTLVYSYYMPAQSTTLTGFLLSYLTNLPSLPKALFSNEPMSGGEVILLGPNIATGPRPTKTEFTSYLQPRGIKAIAWIGPCSTANAKEDEIGAKSANMKWICGSENNVMIYDAVTHDGPWYVYGPNVEHIEKEIIQRMNQISFDRSFLDDDQDIRKHN